MSNMVIRTNVLSLNSHRNLGMTGTAQARASARLSSGFRINSAADDAAGLAISEKMRGQIRGLDQASRNASDGISLIQTAEGAMQTINDMVIRIRELVIQAANDTNVHEAGREELSDRVQIQREIDQLLEEIDAVTLRTEFNTRTLLDGSLGTGVFPTSVMRSAFQEIVFGVGGATMSQAVADSMTAWLMNNLDLLQAGVFDDTANVGQAAWDAARAELEGLFAAGVAAGINSPGQQSVVDALEAAGFTFTQGAEFNTMVTNLAAGLLGVPSAGPDLFRTRALTGTLVTGTGNGEISDEIAGRILDVFGVTGVADNAPARLAAVNELFRDPNPGATLPVDRPGGGLARVLIDAHTRAAIPAGDWNGAPVDAGTAGDENDFISNIFDVIANQLENGTIAGGVGVGSPLWFQIGANEGQGIELNIEAVNTVSMGIDGFRSGQAQSIEEVSGRVIGDSGWITMLDEALAHVTGQRAILGAVQNRLEFTIENLDISSENLQAANSRIRDTDMAREMMRLTQMNVLQQAATAMLAQANQAPQMVLQLLG